MAFYICMLECADGSIYTGHTDDLTARLASHHAGTFKGYTSKRRPLKLIHEEDFSTRDEALTAERIVKGWRRTKKHALARGDWDEIRRLSME